MKYLLLTILFISLISCDNETPQFKDMQEWNNNQQHEVIIPVTQLPVIETPGTPIEAEQDFFQITIFGEFGEVQNFIINNVYIDDNKDMIAIKYTDDYDSEFYLFIDLDQQKYMLVWGEMPLANDWPDAFFSYTGTVNITEDKLEFNISNPTVNIQGQSYKDLEITNLIN